jgi:hypothetical protein
MHNALTQRRDDDMRDPYKTMVEEMQTDPGDAAALAQWVDPKIIVAAFRKIKYDLPKKIDVLGGILDDDKSTPAEKMKAMKELDAIRENSLSHRGIMVHGPQSLGGVTNPLGLPPTVQSVTMTQTKKSVTLAMQPDIIGPEPDEEENIQPLHQETKHAEQTAEQTGADDFFEDERGSNPNIFRPATTEHGQRTSR